jgi:hypothetical protein
VPGQERLFGYRRSEIQPTARQTTEASLLRGRGASEAQRTKGRLSHFSLLSDVLAFLWPSAASPHIKRPLWAFFGLSVSLRCTLPVVPCPLF